MARGRARDCGGGGAGHRARHALRWQERYEAGGLEGLVDAPRLGRASELEPLLEQAIITVRLLTNRDSHRQRAVAHRPQGPLLPAFAAGPIRTCHFVAPVDDHSRYLLGIRAVPTKEAVPILDVLGEAVELCGIPLALMSDNGTPFVVIVRTMLSRFQRTLAELHIRHIPDPDRHALDERQDRGVPGDPPS